MAHRILAEALSRPYPDDLILVTKLGGARRDDGAGTPTCRRRAYDGAASTTSDYWGST